MSSVSTSTLEEKDEQLKGWMQSMDEYDFEYFVSDLWSERGYDTEVSQASNDRGIDVTATRTTPYPQKEIIQAKRYGPNTTVGSPAIQQYNSLKQQEDNVDAVVIVTTNGFSSQAEDIAHDLNVKLVDGDDLVELIKTENLYGTVYQHMELPSESDISREDIPSDLLAQIREEAKQEQRTEQFESSNEPTEVEESAITSQPTESAAESPTEIQQEPTTRYDSQTKGTQGLEKPSDKGPAGIIGGMLLWVVGAAIISSYSIVGTLAIFAGWIALVYMTYADVRAVNTTLDRGISKVWVAIVGFTVLGGVLYLFRRRHALS